MVAPTEAQIVEAVKAELAQDSFTFDLSQQDELIRLLATLELEHDWDSIPSKKFATILSKHSIIASPSTTNGEPTASSSAGGKKKKKKSKSDTTIPKSFIDTTIPLPPGIRSEYFDPIKGKGLVATRAFPRGELLFTEDAYVPTPPPEAFDQMSSGELCAQCFLPISSAPVALAVKNCNKCKYRFCTSACWKQAMATHHTLLCTGMNVEANELMRLIGQHKWQSLHSVARSLARLLTTLTDGYQGEGWKRTGGKGEDLTDTYGDFDTVYARLSSFATVSELERRSRNPGWSTEKSSFEAILSSAHTALCTALDPSSPSQNPKFTLTPTQTSLLQPLFTLPSFLKLLGRSNINMEKFGGLYSLHSFLNHSCSPNVEIRHVPQRGILASMKIAALALRDIQPGEELVISYIDPTTRLGRRQLLLYRDYCFGPCTCSKCTAELAELSLVYDPKKHGVKGFLDSVARKTGADAEQAAAAPQHAKNGEDANLEEELRASLGF
ncbi:hypothetical protein PHSY_006148 [Pseudozyma hubeiensis SY62]|uniref:Histone-lysine N-methyltransferase SET5 n=1 Tax=Pseudozyma hubeiensis (strain SY62) TaxID=1305764 RepID=R9PB28_PSEHS|nr:hypothetical protein PHSY_006148 [Pseudozyma hubeiensis SY62]GAC98554.1 hypothetical protein PHSY_006148 [Pseudozyma hubeiensis SY62]